MVDVRVGGVAVAVAVLLLGAGCGGSDTPAASTEDPPAATDGGTGDQDATASTEEPPDGEDTSASGGGGCPVDTCDDGLLAELSGIPMPDTVEAYAYGLTAADRVDGMAVQQVFLAGSVDDAAAFYDSALQDAGFEVGFRFAEGEEYAVDFTDPEGRPGSISIGAREFHPVVMDVGLETG